MATSGYLGDFSRSQDPSCNVLRHQEQQSLPVSGLKTALLLDTTATDGLKDYIAALLAAETIYWTMGAMIMEPY